MGKAGRKSKHDEKMKKKRALKAQKKAAYLALAGTGKRKKKRASQSKVSGIYKHAHIMADCGNPGCKRCYPRPANNRR